MFTAEFKVDGNIFVIFLATLEAAFAFISVYI